jgi:hypothetical protein
LDCLRALFAGMSKAIEIVKYSLLPKEDGPVEELIV